MLGSRHCACWKGFSVNARTEPPWQSRSAFFVSSDTKPFEFLHGVQKPLLALQVPASRGKMVIPLRRLELFHHLRIKEQSPRQLVELGLRGKKGLDKQWKLFCLVHNIGKIARFTAT